MDSTCHQEFGHHVSSRSLDNWARGTKSVCRGCKLASKGRHLVQPNLDPSQKRACQSLHTRVGEGLFDCAQCWDGLAFHSRDYAQRWSSSVHRPLIEQDNIFLSAHHPGSQKTRVVMWSQRAGQGFLLHWDWIRKKCVTDILIVRTDLFIAHAHSMTRKMMTILPLQLHCSFSWVHLDCTSFTCGKLKLNGKNCGLFIELLS